MVLVAGDDYSGDDAIVLDASGDDTLDLTAYDTVTFTVRRTPESDDAIWSIEATVSDSDTAYVDLPYTEWDGWEAEGSPERMSWGVRCEGPTRTVAGGTIVVQVVA